jgi:hypothetical protein
MQRKIGFIAGLFVFALCALTIFGFGTYEFFDIRQHSQQATMELADADKRVVLFDDVLDTRTLDVKYVSNVGEVVVPQKLVSIAIAERLVAGEQIPIIYLTNNPRKTLSAYHEPAIPWAWLAVGLIAFAVAGFALHLHKREQYE